MRSSLALQPSLSLNASEFRAVGVLASIFALRMLGLCMLLPVFALEANNYPFSSPQLIGMAIGVYGLSQGVLQIPFGVLSDKYGRRPLILVGLLLLLLGSVIASQAQTIYGLILGRILQGCGAIGSVVIATLVDMTREQVRVTAMAVLGISIGLAFVVAMVLGPLLVRSIGMPGVFWVTAALAGLGILLVLFTIPKNATSVDALDLAPFKASVKELLSNSQLLTLNLGIFTLHAGLAALFLVLPLLVQNSGLAGHELWKLYLITLGVGLVLALKLINDQQKANRLEGLHIFAISGLLLTQIAFAVLNPGIALYVNLSLFFAMFCILEASLPTMVAACAPAKNRGAAMGVYSSLQFLGVFCGGSIGGLLHMQFGISGVLGLCMLLTAVWLAVTIHNSFSNKFKVKKWQEV